MNHIVISLLYLLKNISKYSIELINLFVGLKRSIMGGINPVFWPESLSTTDIFHQDLISKLYLNPLRISITQYAMKCNCFHN